MALAHCGSKNTDSREPRKILLLLFHFVQLWLFLLFIIIYSIKNFNIFFDFSIFTLLFCGFVFIFGFVLCFLYFFDHFYVFVLCLLFFFSLLSVFVFFFIFCYLSFFPFCFQ